MERTLTINVDNTAKYLRIWNGLFNLTDMELKILSYFIDINKELKHANLCAPKIKKLVAKQIGFDDHNTLNNYVKKLKDKGVLLKKGRNYTLNSLLRIGTTRVCINIQWNNV